MREPASCFSQESRACNSPLKDLWADLESSQGVKINICHLIEAKTKASAQIKLWGGGTLSFRVSATYPVGHPLASSLSCHDPTWSWIRGEMQNLCSAIDKVLAKAHSFLTSPGQFSHSSPTSAFFSHTLGLTIDGILSPLAFPFFHHSDTLSCPVRYGAVSHDRYSNDPPATNGILWL